MTDRIHVRTRAGSGQDATPDAVRDEPETPAATWQARVPAQLSRRLEADMAVLGLSNRSEAVRRALILLHHEAAEERVEAEYDAWYGTERVPLPDVTAALYPDDE